MKKFPAVAAMLICCLLCSCTSEKKAKTPITAVKHEEPVSIRLMAVGDNLIHSPLYKSCKVANGYDFSCFYENVASYIKDADIAAINQETIFVNSVAALSGYPEFGTPPEVGRDAFEAGFNVVTHATNHVIDKHIDGVFETLDFWKQYPSMTILGIHDTPESSEQITIFGKKGMKLALLNYTYGLNGHVLPKEYKYAVDVYSEEKVSKDLKKAEKIADFSIVFIHFGTEYTHTPTNEQKEYAEFLCENGADLIIGTHPHVIQNTDEIVSENGNTAVVFYSLGNFISNQEGIDKVLCGMADVTITKQDGKTKVETYEMLPLVTHAGQSYTTYMLSDYTDELAKQHRRCRGLSVERLEKLFTEVCSQ